MQLINVEEEMLIYSLRYGLGRHTYCTAIICENIISNLDKLSLKTLYVIARDITEFLTRAIDSQVDSEINNIDNRAWSNLLKVISEKLPEYFFTDYPQVLSIINRFI